MPSNMVKRGRSAPAKIRKLSQNGKPQKGADMSLDSIVGFRSAFAGNGRNRISLNAVTKTSVHSVAQSRASVIAANQVFSHSVDVAKITSQKSSGRCWLFAGLNTMRMAAVQRLDVEKDFEFSQNYLMFWDKLEKANYFYESIIGSVSEPIGSRLLDFLLDSPIQDGGQWDMFINLIRKYGVVPKAVMPETQSSSSTGIMNTLITRKLRADAAKLRDMAKKKASMLALRSKKKAMLSEVYRMLSIHLGEPPTEFDWQWRNKAGDFHREGTMTPKNFMEKFVGALDEQVCLIHCPQASKSYDVTYTVEYLGNVVEGDIVKYLNLPVRELKKAAISMIKDGKAVWFGCDVGKMLDREVGALDMSLYDYDSIYGVVAGLDKSGRLDFGDSRMTHAMVLCGVDLDARGKPRKWRVENSWGEDGEGKGFLSMSDSWFDEFVYEVAVETSYLTESQREAIKAKPVPLPPWDPMGALA